MTLAIWQDIKTRLLNLQADMVGQWQGDLEDVNVEQAIMSLGNVIRQWELAKPPAPPV